MAEMNPADVPDELIKAAAAAYWMGPPPPADAPIWRRLREVVAAVLPLHKQQVLTWERQEDRVERPDPRGPLHQRVTTDWHVVSATGHASWTPDGTEYDLDFDIEHPDECDLLPYDHACLFDQQVALFNLDGAELRFGPRQARAHLYGPDENGDFEEYIEWGKDVDLGPDAAGGGEV